MEMVCAKAPARRYDEVTTPSTSKALSFFVVCPSVEVSMVKGSGRPSLYLHSIFPVGVVVAVFAGNVNVEVEDWDECEFGDDEAWDGAFFGMEVAALPPTDGFAMVVESRVQLVSKMRVLTAVDVG